MDRTTWTDERIDDLSDRMDSGFARVDNDIRELRRDMNAGFADVRGEINGLRTLMLRLNTGLIVSVVAAILVRGI
jgi:hypothetical protein